MILIIVPLLMLVLAWALGGKLDALKELPLRWGGIPIIALGAQWLLVRVPGGEPFPLLGAALVASYALLVAFMVINRRLPGLKLALVGTLLNLAAIIANGGFMPITPETFEAVRNNRPPPVIGQRIPQSKDVLLPRDQAILSGLGDAFTIPRPIGQAFSIGDVAIASGVGLLILVGMQPRLRRSPGASASGSSDRAQIPS
jgi:hypothetical protein